MAESTDGTPTIPKMGDRAPDFQANSSKGPISTKDFKGKWVVLFSHHADFTPVCTTEFIEFARRYEEFEQRNVQLIGLSIDSVYSHIAWLLQMEKIYGVEVNYPRLKHVGLQLGGSNDLK